MDACLLPPLPARNLSMLRHLDLQGSEDIRRNPPPHSRPPPSSVTPTLMLTRKPMPLPSETSINRKQRSVKSKSVFDLPLPEPPPVFPLDATSKYRSPTKSPGLINRFLTGLKQIPKHQLGHGQGPMGEDRRQENEDIHSNLMLLGIDKKSSIIENERENYAELGEVMLELKRTLDINRDDVKKQTRSTVRLTRSRRTRRARDPLPPIPGQEPPGGALGTVPSAPSLTDLQRTNDEGDDRQECSVCHQLMFFLGLLRCSSNHVICIECMDQKEGNVQKCPTCNTALKPYLEPPTDGVTIGVDGTGNASAPPKENEYGLPCGCCYVDLGDDMVQCAEGHLFCTDCLHAYLQEIVYGQSRPPPECMTDGCGNPFPFSQIERVLSEAELEQYGNRLQREAISMAGLLPKIVYCPKCQYAALPDDDVKVFSCPRCQHQSCCECQADWKDHKGLTCDQVEKKGEVNIRLSYEEQMTQVTLRICHKCRTRFTKSSGCNRITCQCGATMCYICRKPNIEYSHFCQHVHDPGKGCKKCKACYLFTNADEDEKRAIEELKKAAQSQREKQGFTDKRAVGAPLKI